MLHSRFTPNPHSGGEEYTVRPARVATAEIRLRAGPGALEYTRQPTRVGVPVMSRSAPRVMLHAPSPAVRLALACVVLLAAGPAAAERAPWVGQEFSGAPCDGQATGFGPFDYTNPTHVREKLAIVERNHFTSKVSSLQGGESGGLLSDIDYTLRAFPNHHRALYTLIRLSTREALEQRLDQWRTPPECYLQRAVNFAPEDGRAHTLFGIYLHERGMHERAEAKYRRAIALQARAPEAHYNVGLLLLEMERYEEARRHARKAYSQGYPLPGLRRKLADAGHPL